MAPDLRFCPACGNEVLPGKKFCTNCGTSLTPDASRAPAEAGRNSRPDYLPAAAGIVGILLVIAGIGFVLSGSGFLPGAGKTVSSLPAPAPTTGTTESVNRSWVEVVPETLTPVMTTTGTITPTTPATLPPTPVPVTTIDTKPVVCASDRLKCNNTCIDPMNDNLHCGICDTKCPAGTFCSQGNCMKICSSGLTSCFGGCFNLQSDADHCGSCTNNCEPGLICVSGRCTAPATPMLVPV